MSEEMTSEQLQALLQKVVKKDSSAIAELFSAYKDRVYYTALKITRNGADAEEVLQDTFIKVIQKAHQLTDATGFHSWLYRITTSTALDYLRKRNKYETGKEEDYMENLADQTSQPSEILFREDLRDTIKQEIANMPDEIAVVAMARYFEEMSIDEIAEDLQLNKNTVKSRLRLFRERMQPILKKKGYAPETYYSVAFLPVLVAGFEYAIHQNALPLAESNKVLASVQTAAVATGGILVALHGKLAKWLIASGLALGGTAGTLHYVNRKVLAVDFMTAYTNKAVPVTIQFADVVDTDKVQILYGDQDVAYSVDGKQVVFFAGENGDYKIIYVNKPIQTVKISSIDELGPSVSSIQYDGTYLSLQASDDMSGINAQTSYIQNGDQVISLASISDWNAIEIALQPNAMAYLYDNAGNLTTISMQYK